MHRPYARRFGLSILVRQLARGHLVEHAAEAEDAWSPGSCGGTEMAHTDIHVIIPTAMEERSMFV